ncbi:short-chain dehydrogenase [Sphingobium sp. TA15]|uniref:SDR-family protein n=3 Tax=Sphingobium indicum TaxID=332055 RepID=D4Z083_SPHIU|nr:MULTISPECIES: SDR family oxidoreductase [Sphingobium]EPR17389.1 short-chain dehydrogenase [Sphingobium indicum IP26]KEY98303.1 short-chain dehydrogenase [Sphingomonas sp. BHC-A]BDD65324.1 short-chain dehydrogenase [Sphingobium sp. TA15]EQA99434.1 short-chain dehydrogenase [Sphingobium sp. HDIP04]KER37453.1 short-chain dehydrogenase [Sphingobium indicum F2]
MHEPRAIFITGGGSGIGRAVALRFAAEDWLVGIADIDEAGMVETAAQLPQGHTSLHLLDVRDRDKWDRSLAEFAKFSGGRLDVMFNNAGIGLGGPFQHAAKHEIDALIDINLRGMMYGAHAAHPYLAATAGSCLLNMASASALYGSAGLAVYSATKYGIRGLSEALDVEWGPSGIKVRCLFPSFVDTPMLAGTPGSSEDSKRDRVLKSGAKLTPVEEVAQHAWQAVHGSRLHVLVGKAARSLAFKARWRPHKLRTVVRG